MQFEIAKDSLLKPLTAIGGVVEKRQTLPVLSNVLMKVEGNTIRFTGTDLEVELTSEVDQISNSEGINGAITLPARKLTDICKNLPDDAVIRFQLEEQRAIIRSGRSRFNLTTIPAEDFPALEDMEPLCQFTIQQQQLRNLLEKTQFCMANQDVRYYLNGLLFEISNGVLSSVATDGHRLAYMNVEGVDIDTNIQVIIPRKGVSELFRLLESSEQPSHIRLNQNFIQVQFGETTFSSKLIDGRFPDYTRVIPPIDSEDKVLMVDRELLRQSLIRTSVLSNEKFRGIRLNLSQNRLLLSINNPEQEEAEEELEIDYPTDQGELEIGFNVSYMIDALGAITTEQVQLRFTNENNSCLILAQDGSGARYVVMPMRL